MEIKSSVFTVVLLSLLSINGSGQNLLTTELIDSVKVADQQLAKELEAVFQYNRAIKAVGMNDTILLRSTGDTFTYNYKGSVIDQILIAPDNKSPVQIHYTTNQYNRHLSASIIRGLDRASYLLVTDEKTCDFRIQVRNEENGVQSGQYIEKCISGEIYEQGFYHQIDSIYRDSTSHIVSGTSGSGVRYMDKTKYAKKCGEWITRIKGRKAVEIYEDCRD